MVARLQRFLSVLLGLLAACTALLYITANADQIAAALQALQPAPVVDIADPPAIPHSALPIEPESPAQAEPSLPAFAYPYLLRGLDSAVTQAVVALGEGDQGNLWLVRKSEAGWQVQMGPVHCRMGAQGLALRKQEGDEKTPIGLSTLHFTGDPPDGGSAVALFAQPQPAPTKGGIALAPRDLQRLLALLEEADSPAVAIFRAADVGWSVEQGMPEQFVLLTEAAPAVREDARYATGENFMGRPLEGYLGHRVVVTREVAAALQQIAEQLAQEGLGLLVYDGYRPARAVEDIFRWIGDAADQSEKQRFYPDLDKGQLPGIYLDRNSPHCTGIAVDLTLCDESGAPLDMGTEFDFFSPRSWVNAKGLTEQQRSNRDLLRRVMGEAGFTPYSNEWWHFNYSAGSTAVRYDFVIPQ